MTTGLTGSLRSLGTILIELVCARAKLIVKHDSPPPFAATLNEFAHDLRLLRGGDE